MDNTTEQTAIQAAIKYFTDRAPMNCGVMYKEFMQVAALARQTRRVQGQYLHRRRVPYAQRLLDENLKKYGLNISDLIGSDSEVTEIYWFAVKDKYQRRLLEQLYGVFIVKDKQYSTYAHKALRYNVGLKMTKSQNAELTLMYDFYLTQWKKEVEKQKDILYRAFISKHSLSLSYADYAKMSDEELKLAKHACSGTPSLQGWELSDQRH